MTLCIWRWTSNEIRQTCTLVGNIVNQELTLEGQRLKGYFLFWLLNLLALAVLAFFLKKKKKKKKKSKVFSERLMRLILVVMFLSTKKNASLGQLWANLYLQECMRFHGSTLVMWKRCKCTIEVRLEEPVGYMRNAYTQIINTRGPIITHLRQLSLLDMPKTMLEMWAPYKELLR